MIGSGAERELFIRESRYVSYRDKVYSLLMVMSIIVIGLPAHAQSILRIEIRDEGEQPGQLARGVHERQLTKFMDEVSWPGEVVYDAHWEAPAAGMAGPVTMVMAYRQADHAEPRRLVVQYPEGVRGRQIARFRIREEQVRQWGAVTAWHIQLRQGNRVLDERSTGRWR